MQLLEQPEPGIRQQYFWLSLERWFVQKTMMLWIQFKRISSHTSTLPEILVRPCPQHSWPEGRSGWPRHLCPRLLGRNWLICNWFLSQYFILIQSFLDIAYQARHIRESVQQTFSNSGPTWYGRRVFSTFISCRSGFWGNSRRRSRGYQIFNKSHRQPYQAPQTDQPRTPLRGRFLKGRSPRGTKPHGGYT